MALNIPLTFAGWDDDRMRGLMDGRVQIAGVDLTSVAMEMPESFRMLHYGDFDVSEMSMRARQEVTEDPKGEMDADHHP
jgi:hypothetical protein